MTGIFASEFYDLLTGLSVRFIQRRSVNESKKKKLKEEEENFYEI